MGAEQSTQVELLTTQQYQRLFKILDKDGSGRLTGDEVDDMFTAILGFETSDHRGKGASFDIQGFKTVCVKSHKDHPRWNVRSNLQKYIEENKGKVAAEDDLSDEPLCDHNLEKLFKIIDTDGSGQLSPMETYELFVAASLPKRILFEILSTDVTGILDFPQFCSVLRSCDEKYPEKGVDEKILNFLQVAMHKGKPPMPKVDLSSADEEVSEMPVGTKKALIIGINYLGTGVQLGGCINDAKAQHDVILGHFGFKEEHVRLLVDDSDDPSAKPTKENMLEAMNWLMCDAKAGDVLFFHFSGHGSQVTDPTGQEADGKNECLCPVDCMGKPWPAAVIVDDYLNDLFFENLPEGVRLTCVYDCCHSGTMMDLSCNRDIGDMMGFDEDAPKDRYMHPPPEIAEQLQAQSAQRGINTVHTVRSRSLAAPGPKQLWSISGCMDSQTSADATIGGQKRGALTWSLISSLEQCNYNVTYDELLTMCRKKLKGKYTQIPQMATTDAANWGCKYVGCGL